MDSKNIPCYNQLCRQFVFRHAIAARKEELKIDEMRKDSRQKESGLYQISDLMKYQEEEVMDIKAVLFDLDGTLLPMDQDAFTKGYFKELAGVLSPLGIEPEALISAVWAGTKAMVKNDGAVSNKEVFWKEFEKLTGQKPERFCEVSDQFYSNEFNRAQRYTGENPLAKEAVRLAGLNGRKVVLATNPLFPYVGQATRLGWIGLKPEDFCLVTSYESDSYCKPNPRYYESICERIGVKPESCLMIGNDEREDMHAAGSIGMNCILAADCMIPCAEQPWNGEKLTFAELVKKLGTI